MFDHPYWRSIRDQMDKAKDKQLGVALGHFCTECKMLCHMHEQGLCCDCGQPWETEVLDESKYPPKWVPCVIKIERSGA